MVVVRVVSTCNATTKATTRMRQKNSQIHNKIRLQMLLITRAYNKFQGLNYDNGRHNSVMSDGSESFSKSHCKQAEGDGTFCDRLYM